MAEPTSYTNCATKHQMADLFGHGKTRVSWMPSVGDASAPTRAELERSVDLGGLLTDGVKFTNDPDAPDCEPSALLPVPTEIVLTITGDVSGFCRAVFRMHRAAIRLERRYRRRHDPASHPPPLKVNGAEYARRRRARRRRR